jgi:hypothetical protein
MTQFSVKGLSKQLMSDTMCCRLASLIPSGTSMSEHKRKHDSTTDDDNRASLKQELVCKLMVTAEERMMAEEKLRPALGQTSGDSFLDIWNRQLLRQEQFRTLAKMFHEKSRPVLGQTSGASFTHPFNIRDICARKLGRLSGTSLPGPFGNGYTF